MRTFFSMILEPDVVRCYDVHLTCKLLDFWVFQCPSWSNTVDIMRKTVCLKLLIHLIVSGVWIMMNWWLPFTITWNRTWNPIYYTLTQANAAATDSPCQESCCECMRCPQQSLSWAVGRQKEPVVEDNFARNVIEKPWKRLWSLHPKRKVTRSHVRCMHICVWVYVIMWLDSKTIQNA